MNRDLLIEFISNMRNGEVAQLYDKDNKDIVVLKEDGFYTVELWSERKVKKKFCNINLMDLFMELDNLEFECEACTVSYIIYIKTIEL